MIDTIEFRIHDLKKHKQFLNTLVKEDINGKSRYLKFIKLKDLIPEYNKRIETRLKFNDTGKDIPAFNANKMFVPSSHYFIIYSINFEKDFIHFNFSLPKFLYGTNILQFLVYPQNPIYTRKEANTITYQLKYIGKRLRQALQYFFDYNFGTIIKLDKSDVEIRRLDFCYNQIFDSKEDALRALDAKMRFKFPKIKNGNNSMRQYDTSISYRSTTGKYFKIYHKGTEYEANDMKRHITMVEGLVNYAKVGVKLKKKNTEIFVTSFGNTVTLPLKPVFNVNLLKDLADRTLRYEITYRPRDISQYFMNQIFRKNCKDWIQKKKIYKHLLKLKNSNEAMTDGEKKLLNRFERVFNRTFSFRYQANRMNDILTHKKVKQYNSLPKEITLTEQIINMLASKFWDYVTHYQLKYLPSKEQFMRKLKDHNKEVDDYRKLKKSPFFDKKDEKSEKLMKYHLPRMTMLFELLRKHTWNEIQAMNLMSKTSFYKARKDFESLGVHRNSIKPMKIKLSLDFKNYYDYILHFENKIITKYISPFSLSI